MNVPKKQEKLLENTKFILKSKTLFFNCSFLSYFSSLSKALLEKETLDLQAIIEILGERPFEPKSNYKAYLEYKKEEEEEQKEIKEHEKKEKEEEEQSAGGVKKEGESGENQEEGPEGVKGGGGIEERGFGHQEEIERKKEAEANKKVKDDRADL